MNRVTPARIAELLKPFHLTLDEFRLNQISTYIDMLVRWNSRINLTAIRDPEEMVVRHFGESLFAGNVLFSGKADVGTDGDVRPSTGSPNAARRLIDVGSGAGFPGLPIKLWNPSLDVTLIESNQKKATFLREVVRALTLTGINVYSARAETHPPATGDIVTLRAVERFEQVLPIVVSLVAPKGRVALLIGSPQVGQTHHLAPNFNWNTPVPIPQSGSRVLLVGQKLDESR